MPGIGIIANPHSKLNKRSPHTLTLMAEAIGQKGVFTITRDLDHLDETLKSYKEQEISILGINGGDGSISQIITRMIAIYGSKPLPLLAVLRGGTMNLIASQLSISDGPVENIKKLVALVDNKRPFRRNDFRPLRSRTSTGSFMPISPQPPFSRNFIEKSRVTSVLPGSPRA